MEPLSRKPVQLQGACQQKGQTLPCMGGSQALLNANVLVAQKQVIKKLQEYQERPELRVPVFLEAATMNMKKALSLNLHHALQQERRLERQLEVAKSIKNRIGIK